jgi:hypothetical protein
MMQNVTITPQDAERVAAINVAIPGWSDAKQYAFFKGVLQELPWIVDILIVGVYQGRDIAYILDLAKRYHPNRALYITGVDKFSDTPCDDWPDSKRHLAWGDAGFGAAPARSLAIANLKASFEYGDNITATIIEHDDAEWLDEVERKFDLAYFDTSHDYATVRRQLRQSPNVTREQSLICGDDYSDVSNHEGGSWGVKRAVTEGTKQHHVFANWIWYCNKSDLK